MSKKLLILLTFCSVPFYAVAQESIGFSNPENIQPLLDYRLPEWGYTNLFLDFSLDGAFQKSKSTMSNSSATDNLFTGRLAPQYIRYYESEPRVSTYRINPIIDYSVRNQTSRTGVEDERDDIELYLQWSLDEKLFLDGSDYFFKGSFSGLFRQVNLWDKSVSESVAEYDEKSLNRVFEPTLSIGIGYGRLRTVNPMIKSLRLNERMNSLDNSQNMTQQDMMQAAEQFTRLNGYQQTYDRPQKYFWGDMDERLATDLSTMDPFDLLYLTDVTSEALGTRREGWEVSATVDLQHNVNYSLDEHRHNGDTFKETSTQTSLTPTFGGSWFKNLSLKHQIGFSGSFQYHKVLGKDSPLNNNKIFNSSASWLYTITDRFLVNTTLNYLRFGRNSAPWSRLFLVSSFDYFIEDSFSLFASADYQYFWNSWQAFSNGSLIESEDERRFRFNVGLRYYFKRGLF